MQKRGIFITFEGTDGAGKSTQAKLLQSWLAKRGKKSILTREPGGGPTAENIRRILLDPATKIDSMTELFLYEAARASHVDDVVRPALDRGAVVLCDRFTDATIAYQGFGRGLDVEKIEILNKAATRGLEPDLTILLDLPAEKGFRKAAARKKGADRLELEGVRFQKKVRRGYLAQAKKYSRRIKVVPVQSSVQATQDRIRAWVEPRLTWKS